MAVRPLRDSYDTVRALTAEAWRALLDRHRHAFGVARVGATTALDDLGVETSTAIRHNPIGSSISVCSGKGETPAEAEAGALGEAFERYCAEVRPTSPRIRTACRRDLPGPSLNLDAVPLGTWVTRELLDSPLDWCQAVRVHDAAAIFVPADFVFFPYTPRQPRPLLAAPTTTGLAAGSSVGEATLHGVLECIERDAYARAMVLVNADRGDLIPGLDEQVLFPAMRARIDRLRAAGLRVRFRDLTHDLRVPTVLATLDDGELAHFGCATHPRAAVAARIAFFEAAQSRITDLQGAREDLTERTGRPHPWFTADGAISTVPGDFEGDGAIHDTLTALDALLERAGAGRTLVVDLSIPAVPAAVVRAIVPALEQWGLDPDRMGGRVRAWLGA